MTAEYRDETRETRILVVLKTKHFAPPPRKRDRVNRRCRIRKKRGCITPAIISPNADCPQTRSLTYSVGRPAGRDIVGGNRYDVRRTAILVYAVLCFKEDDLMDCGRGRVCNF